MLIDEMSDDIEEYGYFIDIEKNTIMTTHKEEHRYESFCLLNKEITREKSNGMLFMRFEKNNEKCNNETAYIYTNTICCIFVSILCCKIWLV